MGHFLVLEFLVISHLQVQEFIILVTSPHVVSKGPTQLLQKIGYLLTIMLLPVGSSWHG